VKRKNTVENALLYLWKRTLDPVTRFPAGDLAHGVAYFRFEQGRFPRLRRPRTFSDHLFKLKFSRDLTNPLRVFVSDKEHVKLYVRDLAGDTYNVPTHAVLRSPEEARRYDYPAPCVIKPTHASGQVIFRHKLSDPIDRERIASWFGLNYYHHIRERNYRALTPKVIVEKPIYREGRAADDYKIYCFHGRPKFIKVIVDRWNTPKANRIYSPQFEPLPFFHNGPPGPDLERPPRWDEMMDLATRLSANFSFVRVDLYWDGDGIYVGELTNLPSAGCNNQFYPPEADRIAGRFFGEAHLDARNAFAALEFGGARGAATRQTSSWLKPDWLRPSRIA
jgi:hypothetical protein